MIFFWLALIAVTFGLLGFLLHAFYFSRQQRLQALSKDIESLKRILTFREKETQDAKEEISKTRLLVHSLEQQLGQSHDAMQALQQATRRQEEEIRLLQKKNAEAALAAAQVEELQRSIAAKKEAVTEAPPAPSYIADVSENGQIDGGKDATPLWKENLNNILGMLDKIEKEVKK